MDRDTNILQMKDPIIIENILLFIFVAAMFETTFSKSLFLIRKIVKNIVKNEPIKLKNQVIANSLTKSIIFIFFLVIDKNIIEFVGNKFPPKHNVKYIANGNKAAPKIEPAVSPNL